MRRTSFPRRLLLANAAARPQQDPKPTTWPPRPGIKSASGAHLKLQLASWRKLNLGELDAGELCLPTSSKLGKAQSGRTTRSLNLESRAAQTFSLEPQASQTALRRVGAPYLLGAGKLARPTGTHFRLLLDRLGRWPFN